MSSCRRSRKVWAIGCVLAWAAAVYVVSIHFELLAETEKELGEFSAHCGVHTGRQAAFCLFDPNGLGPYCLVVLGGVVAAFACAPKSRKAVLLWMGSMVILLCALVFGIYTVAEKLMVAHQFSP